MQRLRNGLWRGRGDAGCSVLQEVRLWKAEWQLMRNTFYPGAFVSHESTFLRNKFHTHTHKNKKLTRAVSHRKYYYYTKTKKTKYGTRKTENDYWYYHTTVLPGYRTVQYRYIYYRRLLFTTHHTYPHFIFFPHMTRASLYSVSNGCSIIQFVPWASIIFPRSR